MITDKSYIFKQYKTFKSFRKASPAIRKRIVEATWCDYG